MIDPVNEEAYAMDRIAPVLIGPEHLPAVRFDGAQQTKTNTFDRINLFIIVSLRPADCMMAQEPKPRRISVMQNAIEPSVT